MHNRKKHAEIEESVAAESESEQRVEASGHDQEKRRAEVSKQPTKRSAVAGSSSKQTKIIYVMPGPAREFVSFFARNLRFFGCMYSLDLLSLSFQETIDFANAESFDQSTSELDQNKSSKDSKYVFFVESPMEAAEELETQFELNS